jgi:hypothetical protein
LACMWFLAVAGCQDEGDLPHFGTLRYESESFEVWASNGLDACGGTFDYTEQWLVAFRERVDEHAEHGRHIFYWLTPEDFDNEVCTTGYACAYPHSNVIYSTVIPAEHEFVHAELDARPPSVLREGAAEVFGSMSSLFTTRLTPLDPLLHDEQIPSSGYQTAGRFSRFIIERHGLDAYFELYESLDGAISRQALAAGVEETLGVQLPALVESFEESSPCSVDRWRYFDHECSTLPLTPWESPTRWAEEIDLSCSAKDVIGPRKGLVWTLRALEVDYAGLYDLTIESTDESAQVAIIPCNEQCYDLEPRPGALAAGVATGGSASVYLAAGRHWLRVEHSDGSDAGVSIAIEQ